MDLSVAASASFGISSDVPARRPDARTGSRTDAGGGWSYPPSAGSDARKIASTAACAPPCVPAICRGGAGKTEPPEADGWCVSIMRSSQACPCARTAESCQLPPHTNRFAQTADDVVGGLPVSVQALPRPSPRPAGPPPDRNPHRRKYAAAARPYRSRNSRRAAGEPPPGREPPSSTAWRASATYLAMRAAAPGPRRGGGRRAATTDPARSREDPAARAGCE